MKIRRIVTGAADDGSAVFVSDGAVPRTHAFVHTPGQHSAIVWATSDVELLPGSGADPTDELAAAVAPPGGTLLLVIEVPPDTVTSSPSYDASAARAEVDEVWPGLTDHFEPGDSGLHATPTTDYVLMLTGELWLELDLGREKLVRAGDIVIQSGTRHSWHNRTEVPARFAIVQVGGRRRTD